MQAQAQLVVQLVIHGRDGVEEALPLGALTPALEERAAVRLVLLHCLHPLQAPAVACAA